MLKKIKWIMLNIVTFVIMAIVLFVPLFTLDEMGTSLLDGKVIFGFHFFTGLTIKNAAGEFNQVIASKLSGLVPLMMLLSMFIIDKLTTGSFGKDLVNFLCATLTFIYIFLLPVIAPTFLNELYVGLIDFNKVWSYWLVFALTLVLFIYYCTIMIISIVKAYKKITNEK